MADKRITTVDEMTSADVNADWFLVVRGTGQDLRRMRMNLLRTAMAPFDLHDDVDTELTTLANADRILISDEGSPGSPQKFATLQRLRSFIARTFDLHDDVASELTAAADADRLLISDEGQAGDPQKWISFRNLKKSVGALSYEVLNTEYTFANSFRATNVAHSLGRPPVMIFPVLVCKQNDNGYSVGDQVYVSHFGNFNATNGQRMTFSIFATSATSVSFAFFGPGTTNQRYIPMPRKDSATSPSLTSSSVNRWRVKAMILG
ncbi:MAG: hypothetical protein OXP73_02000 [Chloroflexota bacterium]|nr:hypothetical protein [Chloroflexota bacterium]